MANRVLHEPPGKAGTAYILSTISGHRVEDVKAASSGPVCFQLYLIGGREASEAVIERARIWVAPRWR